MSDKMHVVANVFLYHKALLKQYEDVLRIKRETDQHYSLMRRDDTFFAAVELRNLSVAWYIDTSMIQDYNVPKALRGTLDKQGWFQLSTNKKIYQHEVKELLQLAFNSAKFLP